MCILCRQKDASRPRIVSCIKDPIVKDEIFIEFSEKEIKNFLNSDLKHFRKKYNISEEKNDEYIKAWLNIGLSWICDPYHTNKSWLNILMDLSEKCPDIAYIHTLMGYYYDDKNKALISFREGAKLGCPTSMYNIYSNFPGDDRYDYLKNAVELGHIDATSSFVNITIIIFETNE